MLPNEELRGHMHMRIPKLKGNNTLLKIQKCMNMNYTLELLHKDNGKNKEA
jgi:hypothetical protein